MKLLVITQKVDEGDQVLGFMVGWLSVLALQVESLEVICLEKGKYNLPSNVRVHSLGKERSQSRVKYLLNFYRYLWQLRYNYNAVWVHMNQIYIILGWPIWRLGNKKISLWYAHGAVSLSLRLATKLTDLIFTSSASGFRLSTPKVKVVGQGIDTNKFNFDPAVTREAGLVVSVGRLSVVKKQRELIMALAQIITIPWRLRLYGAPVTKVDGDYAEELSVLTAKLNLAGQVTMVGSVDHNSLPECLRPAELFVTMSRTGSLDKAVLEAMSMGVIPITLGETFKPVLGEYGDKLAAANEEDWVHQVEAVLAWSESQKSACRQALRDEIVKNHSLDRLMSEIVLNLTHV